MGAALGALRPLANAPGGVYAYVHEAEAPPGPTAAGAQAESPPGASHQGPSKRQAANAAARSSSPSEPLTSCNDAARARCKSRSAIAARGRARAQRDGRAFYEDPGEERVARRERRDGRAGRPECYQIISQAPSVSDCFRIKSF